MNKKKLGDLNLMDDFLFQAIMSYPDIGELFARKILELIFRRQFQNLQVVAQKVYGGLNTDLRGARLDLYVEENDCAKINASALTLSTIWNQIRTIKQPVSTHFRKESDFITQSSTVTF